MKMRHIRLLLLLCAGLGAAHAGDLVSAVVEIPAGSTNAVADITLNRSAGWAAPAIDAIVYSNGGSATGTLSFAAADLGVERSLGAAVTVLAGAGGAVYPVREYTAAGATNTAPYRARTARVTVTQDNTNAAVYTVGFILR